MTNPIAKRGQGAIAPCRVKGQRPLWGLGQRPNSSASDQSQGSRQQRCRQRSVPASNFARPQTRHQAALPQKFREKTKKTALPFLKTGETVPSFDMLDSFSPTIAHSEFRITYASAFFSAGWNSRLRWYAIASSAEQSIHPTGYASATMTKRSCSSAIIVVAR